MSQIFIPERYNHGIFSTLNEAMRCDFPEYRICDIVRYNKEYRDYLRQYGMDQTIEMLSEQLPELENKAMVFRKLRESFEQSGLGDYNIQCLPIIADFRLNGVLFHGLKDVRDYVTFRECWSQSKLNIISLERERDTCDGLEILKLFKGYPCFDSYDYDNENRSYSNYIITRAQITPELVSQYLKLKTDMNYNLCTEHIPTELLPIIYYVGEGDYMLIASVEDVY